MNRVVIPDESAADKLPIRFRLGMNKAPQTREGREKKPKKTKRLKRKVKVSVI